MRSIYLTKTVSTSTRRTIRSSMRSALTKTRPRGTRTTRCTMIFCSSVISATRKWPRCTRIWRRSANTIEKWRNGATNSFSNLLALSQKSSERSRSTSRFSTSLSSSKSCKNEQLVSDRKRLSQTAETYGCLHDRIDILICLNDSYDFLQIQEENFKWKWGEAPHK